MLSLLVVKSSTAKLTNIQPELQLMQISLGYVNSVGAVSSGVSCIKRILYCSEFLA